MVYCTIPRNTLYKINSFPISNIKAILSLVEPINKKESLYIDALDKKDSTFNRIDLTLDKRDPASIDKFVEMSDKN